jgi:hypothetical protein
MLINELVSRFGIVVTFYNDKAAPVVVFLNVLKILFYTRQFRCWTSLRYQLSIFPPFPFYRVNPELRLKS